MKKKWTFMLASAAVLASGLAPLTALAGETGAEYDSNGMVQFRPNTDKTPPVDPSNPDPNNPIVPEDETKPWDPDNPIPGTQGPLSIDFASSFDFGINKISSADETYNARAQKGYEFQKDASGKYILDAQGNKVPDKTKPIYRGNYVQVTDNRGTNAGWTLTVKQADDFKAKVLSADGQKWVDDTSALHGTLTGATISLANANIESNSEQAGVIGRTDKVSLTAGTAVTVMSAEATKGGGTWVNRWGDSELATEKVLDGTEEKDAQINVNKAVTLDVPGKTAKDANVKYLTTLNWTLTNVPGNATIQ